MNKNFLIIFSLALFIVFAGCILNPGNSDRTGGAIKTSINKVDGSAVKNSTPPIVTGLTAVSGPNVGQITLNWNDLNYSNIHYDINWRADSNISYGGIIPVYSAYYVHTTPTPSTVGLKHYYNVRACNDSNLTGGDCGPYSSVVSAYPKLGAEAFGPYNGNVGMPIVLNGIALYPATTPNYYWSITGNANCIPATSFQQNPTINCSHSGTATATLTVTDLNLTGRIATDSALITITDTNYSDITPPTVRITQPANNAKVSGIVLIKADANDSGSGVNNVKFYVDNLLKSTDYNASYTYSWDTNSYSDSNHTIKARATDNAGNFSEDLIGVIVDNIPDNNCVPYYDKEFMRWIPCSIT
jgi:hypothetical protein